MCDYTVFVGGNISAGDVERLTSDWAEHLACQASLPQDHSISSVLLPACSLADWLAGCREMHAQRDDTSEAAPALGAEKPGWGTEGTTLPCGHWGKDQGKKGAGVAS